MKNNVIIGVKFVGDDCILGANDLISEIGDIGQIKQSDGTLSHHQIEPVEPNLAPTIEDKINYIYYKQMGVI